VAALALDASDWNPGVAFCTAESFALGLVQVRVELRELEAHVRRAAVSIINNPSAKESLMAAAFAAMDAMDAWRESNPSASHILATLADLDMSPHEAAIRLWDIPSEILAPILPRERKPVKTPERPPRPIPTATSASRPTDSSISKSSGAVPKAAVAATKKVPKNKASSEANRESDCVSM